MLGTIAFIGIAVLLAIVFSPIANWFENRAIEKFFEEEFKKKK